MHKIMYICKNKIKTQIHNQHINNSNKNEKVTTADIIDNYLAVRD